MKEKWVRINTIEGYEDIKSCYWISNNNEDKVMNRSTEKIMKIELDKNGYKRVSLQTIDGKQKHYKIHILKASVFLFGPNPLSANIVRHLDDCKTNNALTNLAWGTRSDNAQDSIRNGKFNYETATKNIAKYAVKNGAITGAKNGKKRSKPIRCLETGIIYSNSYEASRQLGIDRANISSCCIGKRHTAGGFHFEFVDPISE